MERNEILIKITKSVTKNLGNYNSARIEYGMEKIVDACDEVSAVEELRMKIDAYLEDEFAELAESN